MLRSDGFRRLLGVILAVSYGIGSVAAAVLEYQQHFFSERFDIPSGLMYASFVVQAFCAAGVLVPKYARLAALCLTVTTVGAIIAHFRIGSPATSVTAFVFTGLQLWFWYLSDRDLQAK